MRWFWTFRHWLSLTFPAEAASRTGRLESDALKPYKSEVRLVGLQPGTIQSPGALVLAVVLAGALRVTPPAASVPRGSNTAISCGLATGAHLSFHHYQGVADPTWTAALYVVSK
jgi:hypothetical protein